MKYYAVTNGRKKGVYRTWSECEKQVKGFPNAKFKSFSTLKEAQAFVEVKNVQVKKAPFQKQKALNDQWGTPEIVIFTDGGSRNHGNKRGEHVKSDDKAAWAFLICKDHQKLHATAGEYGATNNKMELTALMHALRTLGQKKWNNAKINAVLDSKYVLQAIQLGWLKTWKKNGWKKSSGEIVANVEIWKEIEKMLPYFPNLKFSWTKGHANNKGNIIVDKLLNATMDKMK